MLTNKLKLNDGKTEFLLIGTRQQLVKVNASTLCVGETSVTCTSVLKTLGCWLDSQFKFETHIFETQHFFVNTTSGGYDNSLMKMILVYY